MTLMINIQSQETEKTTTRKNRENHRNIGIELNCVRERDSGKSNHYIFFVVCFYYCIFFKSTFLKIDVVL